MRYLMICEKPSLTKVVMECYKKHLQEIQAKIGEITFISLHGHVCESLVPDEYEEWNKKWDEIDYPILPKVWKVKPSDFQIIKKIKEALKTCDGIIVGTDSDQEGYNIYQKIEQYLGLEHYPTLRFIEHSLTDSEILKSLLSMTDYHTDPTHIHFTESARLRDRADWLYGMNLSREYSISTGEQMRVGRVKAPTIKLVYDNSLAIDHFVPETYYLLGADYGTFQSILVKGNAPEKFTDLEKIPKLPLDGSVVHKEEKRVSTHAPQLYDLTAIQAEAGQTFGYSPAETLTIIQSLYEVHKVISYPRTQCRYVSSEKAKEFSMMLSHMDVFPELAPYVKNITEADIRRVMSDKQVVNNKEVEKESHDALLPTSNRPVVDGPNGLNEREYNICCMIFKRLLSQFLPALIENKVVYTIQHGDRNFIAKGKTVEDQGWRVLYKQMKDQVLPNLNEGDPITAEKMGPIKKVTTPPKRLTQATLLAAMKNIANLIEDKELKKSLAQSQGIGTPATRAAIITEIIKVGYVKEEKKGLYITDTGKRYIESLNGMDIVSPIFAAEMDTKIKKIQRGEASYESTYQEIVDDLKRICKAVEQMPKKSRGSQETSYPCLKCGSKLREQKFSYNCPECDFKIPKQICGHIVDDKQLQIMYKGKSTAAYTFKKKDGTTFHGRLKLTKDGIAFDFSSGIQCPYCGKEMNSNRGGVFCECGVKIFNPIAGKKLTDTDIKKLLKNKRLPKMNGFKGKNGSFSASLVLEDKAVKFKFD